MEQKQDIDLLQNLEKILQKQPFLGGSAPNALDFDVLCKINGPIHPLTHPRIYAWLNIMT